MAQGTATAAIPKISYASTMIVEDHLKKMLTANTNHPFKPSDNKHLPKMKHSPFGDFPADYMKGKKLTASASTGKIGGDIATHELSVAAKGIGKSFHVLVSLATIKKGEGLGGKTTSLLKPKDKPAA